MVLLDLCWLPGNRCLCHVASAIPSRAADDELCSTSSCCNQLWARRLSGVASFQRTSLKRYGGLSVQEKMVGRQPRRMAEFPAVQASGEVRSQTGFKECGPSYINCAVRWFKFKTSKKLTHPPTFFPAGRISEHRTKVAKPQVLGTLTC